MDVENFVTEIQSTHFAPARRAPKQSLEETIRFASTNAVLNVVLQSVGGLLAVLNEQRQIIALNDAYLSVLGIEEASPALGLRPGEAIRCTHAEDHPGGCGTSRFCATCGAAIAMVACQSSGQAETRECVLSFLRDGVELTLDLQVRASPLELEDRRFMLLFLEDVSLANRRAALERVFFHDVSNLVTGLLGTTDLLQLRAPDEEVVPNLSHLVERLQSEVEIQRTLAQEASATYRVHASEVPVSELIASLGQLFQHHPVAEGRRVDLPTVRPGCVVKTDPALLLRLVSNMVTNGLEASAEGQTVRVTVEEDEDRVRIAVWNHLAIPVAHRARIFQRYFTTKSGTGRGHGTWAMKLFGEQYLGAEVGFTTDEGEGTTFHLAIPCRLASPPG